MNELPPEVVRDLQEGRWISAIKGIREHLGTDLRSAKELVDAHRRGEPLEHAGRTVEPPAARRRAFPAKVVGLLHQGRRIDAIRELREAWGLGLKGANDEVTAYLKRHPDLERLNASGGGRFLLVAAIAIAVVAYVAWRTL